MIPCVSYYDIYAVMLSIEVSHACYALQSHALHRNRALRRYCVVLCLYCLKFWVVDGCSQIPVKLYFCSLPRFCYKNVYNFRCDGMVQIKKGWLDDSHGPRKSGEVGK
jgi:hypothetical protein